MSPKPDEIDDYVSGNGGNNTNNIWNKVERVALRNGGKVTTAYAVNATDPSQALEIDLQTEKAGAAKTLSFTNPP